nr:transposase [Alkalinema sp. FACHB-956]
MRWAWLQGFTEELFHEFAWQKAWRIVEGHLCSDHIHRLISISQTTAVAVELID